jgi:membrane-associated phospholipid phosphatase
MVKPKPKNMNSSKLLLLLVIISIHIQAQPHRSINDGNIKLNLRTSAINWKGSLAAPILLVGIGIASTVDNDFIFRDDFYEQRNKWMPRFRTHADDYLQYAPIAGVILLNTAGVKGEHNILNQAFLLIRSELIMTAIVFPMKILTAVPRPDTRALNSFPSGHTAQAFVAATFLHKEYGKSLPLLSVLSYSTATVIGLLRVMNNRHWISDVLVGAGIGILSTNLAYLTHQNKLGHNRKQLSRMQFFPMYAQRSVGMGIVIPID